MMMTLTRKNIMPEKSSANMQFKSNMGREGKRARAQLHPKKKRKRV
jgi:hypothetical protein